MFRSKFLLILSLILALAASSSSWAQQFARPASTGATNGWTAVNAATHHEAVNEATADDNDYVNTGDGNNATITLGLGTVTDPGGANLDDHILRTRK